MNLIAHVVTHGAHLGHLAYIWHGVRVRYGTGLAPWSPCGQPLHLAGTPSLCAA